MFVAEPVGTGADPGFDDERLRSKAVSAMSSNRPCCRVTYSSQSGLFQISMCVRTPINASSFPKRAKRASSAGIRNRPCRSTSARWACAKNSRLNARTSSELGDD